jgi:probable Rubsico expression protein CbbX
MRTFTSRHPRLSLLLLVVIALLVSAWLRLSHPEFTAVLGGIVFVAVLSAAIWDSWRQTTPASLESRGMYADDSSVPAYDPGLRREYAPMLPFSLGPSTSIPKPARTRPARAARTPQRIPVAHPESTVTFAGERQAAGVDDLFAALDRELIGLAPVKRKVDEIASLLLVDKARQRFGLSASRPNLHMCFTGMPGTGKTTVALMMADLLHRLGYLEQGQVVHAMRNDLVGEFIGQTAPRTRQVLSRAVGGVLFIDEAYSLYRGGDSKDYGQECIDILMQVMENDRDRIVVILAGYQDRMEAFFGSNPGMRSRIAHHLDFAPYQPDELIAIGQQMLDQSSYHLSPAGLEAFRFYLSREMGQPGFANARSVRNALEAARLRHAHRLAAEPERPWTKDDLMRLEPRDILDSDPV